MYHELETGGRRLCQDAPGYLRYVVRTADFRAQMERLKAIGWRGVDVSEALLFRPSATAITFDDGCETDLLSAAPVLLELGFGATFYVTLRFLGRPGNMTPGQLRELSSLGFQIGCHSMTHAYLSDLDDKDLRREIVDSKIELEQLIGKTIEHFSCPGGRYNQKTVEMVQNAGYRTLASSHVRINFEDTDKFALGRIPVMRRTTVQDFGTYCLGRRLWHLRTREWLGQIAKGALGNRLYDRVREASLRE